MLVSYYKGKTSFLEMMSLPLSTINALYLIAVERHKTEQGKEQEESEKVQDELEEMM